MMVYYNLSVSNNNWSAANGSAERTHNCPTLSVRDRSPRTAADTNPVPLSILGRPSDTGVRLLSSLRSFLGGLGLGDAHLARGAAVLEHVLLVVFTLPHRRPLPAPAAPPHAACRTSKRCWHESHAIPLPELQLGFTSKDRVKSTSPRSDTSF